MSVHVGVGEDSGAKGDRDVQPSLSLQAGRLGTLCCQIYLFIYFPPKSLEI